MLSRNEVKYIQSLCHKKQRQQDGLFIAEGPKLAEEILNCNYTVEKIYALPEWIANNTSTNVIKITEKELEQISQLQTPNQVVVIVKQKATSPIILKNKITIVLDGIQDPGNMGTIIRLADWFGIEQIICSTDTVELYNPKVIQSTMGSFTRVHVCYEDLKIFLPLMKLPLLAATLDGESIYTMPKIKEGLLLIGSEGKGISNELLPFISQKITIPKRGGAESLNAAVATGIILSHLI